MIWLFRIPILIARRLPPRLTDSVVGTLLLVFAWRLNPWQQRVVLSNLRRIFGQDGAPPLNRRLREIARNSIRNQKRLLLSLLARPSDVEYARNQVDLEFLPQLEAARKNGKGVILYFSDFGLYTYSIMALLLLGIPLRIPILDRRTVTHMPHGWPSRFLSIDGAAPECLAALSRNEIVAITTMFNHLPKRLSVPFFGAPARISYAPAGLAAASGAPILPVFTLPAGNDRLRAVSDGPVSCQKGPHSLPRTTELLARIQEKYIRRYPELWTINCEYWNLSLMDLKYQLGRITRRWI